MSPGNCDKKMNEFVTRSESRSVTAHGIFNSNITDEAVQKYIKEQAEESRKEDSRSTAL